MSYWSDHTSLRTGTGKIEVLRVSTLEETADFTQGGKAFRVVGNFTNLTGWDEDDGLPALRPSGTDQQPMRLGENAVRLGAGMALSNAIAQLARQGLGGMARLSGIPGSIGGAAAMNAGALGSCFADFLLALDGWDWRQRRPWHWENSQGGYGYRTSPIPPEVLVLSADLKLQPVSPVEERKAIQAERKRRARFTPQGPSAGSVFRNPEGAPPAGALLESAGCKGLKSGGVHVSPQHANWILNLSSRVATAEDVWALVAEMQSRVEKRHGIHLIPEIRKG